MIFGKSLPPSNSLHLKGPMPFRTNFFQRHRGKDLRYKWEVYSLFSGSCSAFMVNVGQVSECYTLYKKIQLHLWMFRNNEDASFRAEERWRYFATMLGQQNPLIIRWRQFKFTILKLPWTSAEILAVCFQILLNVF